MSLDKWTSLLTRFFFFAAFALLALTVIERATNFYGYTILRGFYTGGRLLEFAAVLLIFVIALLLRQTREELKRRNSSGK